MARLGATVTVVDDKGRSHTFTPADEVPGWAVKVIDSNPSAWAEPPTADAPDEGDGGGYDAMTKADLEAEVERRNADRGDDEKVDVASRATKADIVAALQADDAR